MKIDGMWLELEETEDFDTPIPEALKQTPEYAEWDAIWGQAKKA